MQLSLGCSHNFRIFRETEYTTVGKPSFEIDSFYRGNCLKAHLLKYQFTDRLHTFSFDFTTQCLMHTISRRTLKSYVLREIM